MKTIKKYNQFVNEHKVESMELIITKGKELFHSSIEDFEPKKLSTGSYDNILWTTEYSAISQTYIPVSGSSMLTMTEHLSRPKYNEGDRNILKQLGVDYDYSEVEFDEHTKRAISWKVPEVFRKESDKAYNWKQKHYQLHKDIQSKSKEIESKQTEFELNYKNRTKEEIGKFKKETKEDFKELFNMEDEYEKQSKEFNDKGSSTKYQYDFINKALYKLGYKPTNKDTYTNNYSWELKITFNENKEEIILPSGYRAEGRLFIIKPKRDLKIYDLTLGGKIDGDLTDLDYHRLSLFEKVEKDGYDGIKINDFAQIESEGNFSHTSIGLFKGTIKDLDIVSIKAEHPENFGEVHVKTRDYESKEYKEYKASQ